MMTQWSGFLRCVLMASFVFVPVSVRASGHIGPWPLAGQIFRSHSACVAHLESLQREDAAIADPQPISTAEDGTTKQRLVQTKGIEKVDRRTARYAVHVGHQFRMPRPDINAIRTTYSYEERKWVCQGRRLSGEGRNGYYLDGYEYLQPREPQKTP